MLMTTENKPKGTHGGARPGAGRKKGVPDRKTAETQRMAEESGMTPLEYMLKVMRQPDLPNELPPDADAKDVLRYREAVARHDAFRMDAAKTAAPYVHAKLSTVEMNGKVSVRTLADELSGLNDDAERDTADD